MKMRLSHRQIALLLKLSTAAAAFVAAFVFFWYIPMLGWEIACGCGYQTLFFPCLAAVEFFALLVFLALWQFWQVCRRIEENNSFCRANALSFRRISFCALAAAALTALVLRELLVKGYCNAAWFIILALVICGTLGVFVLAFCLSQLIANAAELKEQADLTI